jgi:REP element-mobilizing transposase RayT
MPGSLAAISREHYRPLMRRRAPAHPPPIERVGPSIIVFLTTCTDRRGPILASADSVTLLRNCWNRADAWLVGRYVVVPDHIHLFCTPVHDVPLARWVKHWKSSASRVWPRQHERPLWQRDFWDTRCDRPTGTTRNGNTCVGIRFVMDSSTTRIGGRSKGS